jgi:Prokaryotic N-terminal methylation motif
MRDDGGFTLVELLVGIAVSLVTMSMVATMVVASIHNEARVAVRVDANQRIRPELTRIVDELHSACVAPRIAPVIGGIGTDGLPASTATRISFLSKSGNEVSPRPDKHVIELTNGTLNEWVFQGTGGAAPTWTYSSTPVRGYDPRVLLTNVSAPGGVVFKYNRFQNGQLVLDPPLTSTPLLSTSDAGLTAYVSVSITAAPTGGTLQDANSPITLSDSVDLRLQPASQIPNQDNLPCT